MAFPDDKPVKITVELPAPLHRDLIAYAEILARETGKPLADPMKLIISSNFSATIPAVSFGWRSW